MFHKDHHSNRSEGENIGQLHLSLLTFAFCRKLMFKLETIFLMKNC